jgi:ribosome-binding factor A
MTDAPRARKLAGRIHEIVASMLRTQVKDPRLGMVTVTDVRLTPDLRDATVFYTVLGDEREQAATAAALESAKGVLRSQVGRQTGVKFTPTLSFAADTVPDNAAHINDLLARAHAADAQLHQARVGASYAGEADPYRSSEQPDGAPDGDGADGGR